MTGVSQGQKPGRRGSLAPSSQVGVLPGGSSLPVSNLVHLHDFYSHLFLVIFKWYVSPQPPVCLPGVSGFLPNLTDLPHGQIHSILCRINDVCHSPLEPRLREIRKQDYFLPTSTGKGLTESTCSILVELTSG